VLALTNDDGVNAEACEIAKKQFGIPFVISRAHQPENMTRIKEAGADVVICPSLETRRLFLNALESRFSEILYEQVDLDFKIVLATVPRNGSIIGKTINELELSENCRITCIMRNSSCEFPTESFMFKGEDRVFLMGMSQFVDKAVEKLVNVELT
jgi:trk system potassium uptake protein TrkA